MRVTEPPTNPVLQILVDGFVVLASLWSLFSALWGRSHFSTCNYAERILPADARSRVWMGKGTG